MGDFLLGEVKPFVFGFLLGVTLRGLKNPYALLRGYTEIPGNMTINLLLTIYNIFS
jgi:hypothetical protein